MRRLLAALALTACSAAGDPTGVLQVAYTGVVGADPNPLTFWWYAGDRSELVPALECAIERIREATCLPVDVSVDAAHWVRHKTAADLAPYGGWTSGTWASTRISIRDDLTVPQQCQVLVHEIGQHVLRRRNDHSGPEWGLSELLLTSVCSVQECECFNPEPPIIL